MRTAPLSGPRTRGPSRNCCSVERGGGGAIFYAPASVSCCRQKEGEAGAGWPPGVEASGREGVGGKRGGRSRSAAGKWIGIGGGRGCRRGIRFRHRGLGDV